MKKPLSKKAEKFLNKAIELDIPMMTIAYQMELNKLCTAEEAINRMFDKMEEKIK